MELGDKANHSTRPPDGSTVPPHCSSWNRKKGLFPGRRVPWLNKSKKLQNFQEPVSLYMCTVVI
jgi:hypothetical protein